MNRGTHLWAVVPVKLFADTKRRLMPLLAANERAGLARAMLDDVLSALVRVQSIAGILVITGDAEAAAMAQAAGATVVNDAENSGTSAAVSQAARHLSGTGRSGMLVVPADVPLISPEDIETIVAAHRTAPAVTLVPAGMDGGTNALACSPPAAIPFCFGDDSFHRHREAARAAGIEPQVLRIERIANDLDRPADLAAFLAQPSPTQTHSWLVKNRIAERLRCAPGSMQDRFLPSLAGEG